MGLMKSITQAHLPAAHGGIADGPVVSRDGDVFGHTVNLAARIGSHATAGELLVHRSIADRLESAFRWEDAGVAQLKGIEAGVPLARIVVA
jgi:adenylate cyclase